MLRDGRQSRCSLLPAGGCGLGHVSPKILRTCHLIVAHPCPPSHCDFAPLHVVNSVLQQNSFRLLKCKAQDRRMQSGISFSLTRVKKIVFQCKMAKDTLVNSLSICKLQKYKGREESGTGASGNKLDGNWLHPCFCEFRRPCAQLGHGHLLSARSPCWLGDSFPT